MKFKNLNVKWNKITALFLAGTMMFSLSGCGKNSPDEKAETAYIQMVEQKIDDYLKLTQDYNKAKEIYEIDPTVENLENLRVKTVELSESVADKLREKIGIDFYCYIYHQENGNIKYSIYDPEDENIAFTHVITAEGEKYGEINSEIITDGLVLVYGIPNKDVNEWSDKDVKNFIKIADDIDENAKDVCLTDFEIKDGNIYEVKPEIKKNVKE